MQKAIPGARPKGAELYTIGGAPPDLSQPLPGCPFAPRCEFALEKCRSGEIPLAPGIPDMIVDCGPADTQLCSMLPTSGFTNQ
ncbi:MAG: hypothetical protein HYX74_02625 [Acidobacteria bacterium]|nr:hypothetical protein [Acidobacteriota bacterium]